MNAIIETLRRIVRSELLLVCAASASLTSAAWAQQPQGQDVDVDDLGTVTLTVKDTDLAQVLEMLAIQSRKNIITSKNVSGTISANLYDVTFYEALDAILRVNGYGYMEEGNFIYVYTGPELEEIQRSTRRTESRVYELEHLAAADAFEFITPLLSEAGRASFRGDVPTGFKPDIADGGADSYAFTPRLVVNDFPENLDEIATLLSDLDTAPQQVLVESTIVQAQLDEKNAFGIDFAVIGDLDFLDITRPLSAVDNLLNGSDESNGFQPDDNEAYTSQSTVGGTAGEGGLKIGIMNNDISIFLRVLDEVTDSVVLARPKVMCLNRQRAEVLVGARVGFLSTTATETSTTQSVEFLDTGIQLVFRPFISSNGMIRMEMAPSVSEASLRSVTDANGLIVTIPDELTNELTTNVRVPDGQTLILGGLFRESTRYTRRQVPFLGDIPILGAAFRGQDGEVDRNEIIFLITPTIIEDNLLGEFGREALTYIDSARVGIRAGLLPFSRERMVDGYNQDAVRAYERGDVEKALYYANTSLRAKPAQPEMVRFREQITGASENFHEQDLMQRILRRKLGKLTSDDPDKEVVHVVPATPPAFLGTNTIVPPAPPVDESPVEPVTEQQWVMPNDPRQSADASEVFDEANWNNADTEIDAWADTTWTADPVTDDASASADQSGWSVDETPVDSEIIVPSTIPAPEVTVDATDSIEAPSFEQMHRSFLQNRALPETQTVDTETIEIESAPTASANPQFETFDTIDLLNGQSPQSESSQMASETPTSVDASVNTPVQSASADQSTTQTSSTTSSPAPVVTAASTPSSPNNKNESDFPIESFEQVKAVPTEQPTVVRRSSELADASEEGDFPIDSFDVEEPASEPIEVVEVPANDAPNN
jgi:type IV pilus secretin PilQ/predicted competence protein